MYGGMLASQMLRLHDTAHIWGLSSLDWKICDCVHWHEQNLTIASTGMNRMEPNFNAGTFICETPVPKQSDYKMCSRMVRSKTNTLNSTHAWTGCHGCSFDKISSPLMSGVEWPGSAQMWKTTNLTAATDAPEEAIWSPKFFSTGCSQESVD